MSAQELINVLGMCDPGAEIRIATQPGWPLEYPVQAVALGVPGAPAVRLVAGEQLGSAARQGWCSSSVTSCPVMISRVCGWVQEPVTAGAGRAAGRHRWAVPSAPAISKTSRPGGSVRRLWGTAAGQPGCGPASPAHTVTGPRSRTAPHLPARFDHGQSHPRETFGISGHQRSPFDGRDGTRDWVVVPGTIACPGLAVPVGRELAGTAA